MLSSFTLPDLATNTPFWLQLAATAAGAVQGALLARKDQRFDVVGMTVLAMCLGFGGGIIRDVLVGHLPPVAFQNPWYLVDVLVSTVLVYHFARFVVRFGATMILIDALTVGLYGTIGVQAALFAHIPLVPAIMIGSFAAVGGGVAASLLRNEVPMIMRPGPPYALAALSGTVSYGIMIELAVNGAVASALAIALTIAVRFLTWRLGYETRPTPKIGRGTGARRPASAASPEAPSG